MSKNPLIRLTKVLLDFMFFSGILVCVSVPFLFHFVGDYFKEFERFYYPLCIIFLIAGICALVILRELRRMFRSVILEDPFVKENVISLKRMGICAFLIALLMGVRLFLFVTFAAMVLVIVFLIAGLFSMVLSIIFDKAVTYKEENDLTI